MKEVSFQTVWSGLPWNDSLYHSVSLSSLLGYSYRKITGGTQAAGSPLLGTTHVHGHAHAHKHTHAEAHTNSFA